MSILMSHQRRSRQCEEERVLEYTTSCLREPCAGERHHHGDDTQVADTVLWARMKEHKQKSP